MDGGTSEWSQQVRRVGLSAVLATSDGLSVAKQHLGSIHRSHPLKFPLVNQAYFFPVRGHGYLRELDRGIALVERALQLNPNLMDAWLSSGLVRLMMADWRVAIDHFARAMRLSPFDPMLFMMQQGTAGGHFHLGQYEDAASWAAKSVGEYPTNPSAWRIAAASHAWLGRQDQAKKAMARLRQLDPSLRLATLKFSFPLPSEAVAKMREGLRKAGLPE